MQREEFKRLGVEGDWEHYYSTMAYKAEATIAAELMKFAHERRAVPRLQAGDVERGGEDGAGRSRGRVPRLHERHGVGEVSRRQRARDAGESRRRARVSELATGVASVVIWTTTPWTIPGNRAISYSSKIAYGLYEVTAAPEATGRSRAISFILADKLARGGDEGGKDRGDGYRAPGERDGGGLAAARRARIRLRALGYDFEVPCSPAITSRTRTARASCIPRPATAARTSTSGWRTPRELKARGIDTTIPFTVDGDGRFTKDAPGFEGKRVIDDKGNKGDANEAVIKALAEASADRARPAQAPVSALLALQEAGDLPQHAAVVHRHGQAAAARRARAANARCARLRSRPSRRPSSCRPPGRTGCAA